MMAGNDFTDDDFKPANIRQPLGRSDEQAQVEQDLMAVDGHAGQDVQMARRADGSVGLTRDLAGKPVEVALTELTGRGVGQKPQLDVRVNYVGGSGVGSGSLIPNTPDGVSGPETLDE